MFQVSKLISRLGQCSCCRDLFFAPEWLIAARKQKFPLGSQQWTVFLLSGLWGPPESGRQPSVLSVILTAREYRDLTKTVHRSWQLWGECWKVVKVAMLTFVSVFRWVSITSHFRGESPTSVTSWTVWPLTRARVLSWCSSQSQCSPWPPSSPARPPECGTASCLPGSPVRLFISCWTQAWSPASSLTTSIVTRSKDSYRTHHYIQETFHWCETSLWSQQFL